MCGRFCCSLNAEDLRNELHQENVLPDTDTEWIDQDAYRPSYNVCPSRSIPAVVEKTQTQMKVIQSMQWGFIPSWVKSNPYTKPINARAETLEEKQSIFDKSKNVNRCIIAAEGFFEWNKKKQVFFIKRKDSKMMLFAGLYSTATIDDRSITTCTIVTTTASKMFSKIHHRMPVILEPAAVNTWINSKVFWSSDLLKLLTPFDGELTCYQVTDKVGPVKNDGPELVQPLDEHKSSISHFLKPADIKDEISKDLSPHVEKVANTGSSSTTTAGAQQATKKRKKSMDDDAKASNTPKITRFFSKK
ncbi:hypothetical protein V8B55DRAFT_1554587 [Mucor lusitanicus]|uniref:Embryonic stem cell-specific 5-hydroxymethylcytosine-binding protein n=2 Tax=Mucor circinelloides f. lusitanicus TaxID=29924 RepID=A0A168GYX2_MUCCL|nr:hypothetical protein FB192DRAFT_1406094 [Mucor lusitanicus]OAC98175.1 hypothetical protein MUCCIDRAFT_86500 [Mucor lusitanicus CBS 277.49]